MRESPLTSFRVAITADFLDSDGRNAFGAEGIDRLSAEPGMAYGYFARHTPVVSADQLEGCDAVISLTPAYTREVLLSASERLLAVVRFGVGYENVDVAACTDADAALIITSGGVRRPVAYSILTLLLALAHRLPAKDRLVREGRWAERTAFQGAGLTGKTLGSVGLGGIAREMFRLTGPFEMRPIAYDPYADPASAAELGVELVTLDRLCEESDYLTINCFLSPETRHLISERQLARMKPTAYLINTARGGIVDEAALIRALQDGTIAGAGLDVFEEEPFLSASPLKTMDNVILSPHSLCWTEELYRNLWTECADAVIGLAQGRVTGHVVNREVLDRPGFRRKLERFRS